MTMIVRITKIDFVELLGLENEVISGICTGAHGFGDTPYGAHVLLIVFS